MTVVYLFFTLNPDNSYPNFSLNSFFEPTILKIKQQIFQKRHLPRTCAIKMFPWTFSIIARWDTETRAGLLTSLQDSLSRCSPRENNTCLPPIHTPLLSPPLVFYIYIFQVQHRLVLAVPRCGSAGRSRWGSLTESFVEVWFMGTFSSNLLCVQLAWCDFWKFSFISFRDSTVEIQIFSSFSGAQDL